MPTYSSVLAAANITGAVYNDYNGNGVRDNATGATSGIAADSGVQGVTVKAFDESGTNCATTTTAADGSYTLPMGPCAGTMFRVEFSNFPAGYQPVQVGTQNATTTQFVTEGGTANLGVNIPGNFCQNNPVMTTSCMRFGAFNDVTNVGEQVIKGAPYAASSTSAMTLNLGSSDQTGSTWGQAWRPSDRSLYSAAFYKRHADLGPSGTGAIYKSTVPVSGTGTAAASLFATIPNTGTDSHPVSTSNCNGRDGTPGTTGAQDCWFYDQHLFGQVYKRGLGDIETYIDPANSANDALFAVNLNDRNLYKVTNLNGAPSVSAPIATPLALPGAAQGCALADVRPFALTIDNATGIGYIGLTCSAQSTGLISNLRSYVYTFDPVTNAFGAAPVLEVPLDFERGCASSCSNFANWQPWTDTFNDPPLSIVGGYPGPAGETSASVVYPQPILSDIVISANGTMSLGFRDRLGDQTGHSVGGPNPADTTFYYGRTAGDILRACNISGTWTLESNGLCNGLGPGPAGENSQDPSRGQGPGGNEFYNFEYYAQSDPFHDEVSTGGMVSIPGFNEVMQTTFDPLFTQTNRWNSGGTHTYNTNTAALINSHEIYQPIPDDQANGTFGKANGLGDLEALCDQAPVEVGNRIWRDSNNNGVQDADEPAIAGVTVRLYDSSDNLLSTVVTDTDGGYYFSNRTVDENGNPLSDSTGKDYGITGLITNSTNYRIRLDNPADYADPLKLEGLTLTAADSTQDNGNNQNDSDGGLPGSGGASATNAPFVAFNTGAAGANNHTYDFGFVLASSTTPPTGGGGTPPDSPSSSSAAGGLANTGQNILVLLAAGVILVSSGLALYYYRRRLIQVGSR